MKTAGMAEITPWLFLASNDTVVTKDSMLLGGWEFEGVDTESFHYETLLVAQSRFDDLLRGLKDYAPVVWTRVDRRTVRDYHRGEFDIEIADGIDRVWGEWLSSDNLWANRHYLFIGIPTTQQASTIVEDIRDAMSDGMTYAAALTSAIKDRITRRKKFGITNSTDLERWLSRWNEITKQTIDGGGSGLQVKRLKESELLGFLKHTVSANPMSDVAVNHDEYLDDYLSDSFLDNSFADYLVLDGHLKKRYIAVFSLKRAPDTSSVNFLQHLLQLSVEMSITSCWKSMPDSQADRFLSRARTFDEMRNLRLKSLLRVASSGASSAISYDDTPKTAVGEAAQEMRDAIRHRSVAFGWLATSIIIYADSKEKLEDDCEFVVKALNNSGLVFIREREGALSGFAVGIPGQLRDPVRWHFSEASALTNVTPMETLSMDQPFHPLFSEGREKPLPPTATFRSVYGTPVYFNYHVGQTGHTLIIGPTRNGKTIFQMFLESQFLKYPNSMIFNIDKDLSLKPATLLLDGEYIDLNPDKRDVVMNPLAAVKGDAGKAWLVGWLDRLMSIRGQRLSDKEIVEVSKAADRVLNIPGARLSTLASQLPEAIRARLIPWCEGGVWGKYFDNTTDTFALSRITSVDVGTVLAAGLRDIVSAFTDYAFYRIDQFLMDRNGSTVGPTMIYFEEAGYLLDDPIFSDKARDYLMTLAKKRAFLVMTAQSPEPFVLNQKLGAAVRDNVATIIFLPNAQAELELAEKYKHAFGLQDVHLSQIANAIPQRHYCIYRPQSGSFRVVDAKLPPLIIATLRSDAKTTQILNRYYDKENTEWKKHYIDAVLEL